MVSANKHVQALTDIWVFADLIKFRGGATNFSQVHRDMTEFLLMPQRTESFENRRRLVLMSRGHLKSTVCSVLYTLWRVYRNPNIRILVGTNIKRLARGFIRELRQYFENKELQDDVWNKRPHVEGPLVPVLSAADKRTRNSRRNNGFNADDGEFNENVSGDTKMIWSGESLQMTRPAILKEPTIQVASVGSIMTGDHYDLLILDDTVDFDNSNTRSKADTLLDWTRDLESVVDPRTYYDFQYKQGNAYIKFRDYIGDEVVTLGTLYYEWDFYHYLQNDRTELGINVFKRNVFVNGTDNTEGYTWPERFNDIVVNGIRRRINNSQRFSSQYLNAVIAPSNAPFALDKVKWFQQDQAFIRPDRHAEVLLGGTWRRIKPRLFIDPAATANENSDFTVLGVGGLDENSDFYLLDLVVGKFTPTQVCEYMFMLMDRWLINTVTVEMVAGFALYRHVIEQEMKRRKRVIGIEDYRPPARINKVARIETALEPHFTNGSFYCSNHLNLIPQFRTELTTFPRCKHDDVLDVVAALAVLGSPTRKKGHSAASTPRRVVNTQWGGTRA